MRQARRALSLSERNRAAQACAQQLMAERLFHNAERIAAYLATDGELDPQAIIQRAWAMGKQVFLPVLRPLGDNRLWFARYKPDTPLCPNRFGILEPAPSTPQPIHPLSLDVVLTPLVAFDKQGHRLGMGGGFYDRSFAYLLRHRHWFRPRLIGLAYAFQQQTTLAGAPWDVPLHAIVTDQQYHRCGEQNR